MSLLFEALKLGKQEFELLQQRAVLSGAARSFRVLESAKCSAIGRCFEQVSRVLQTCSEALPQEYYHFKSRSILFRMLSSFLCHVHASMRRFNRGFPNLLFRILEGKEMAKYVYSSKRCFHDELAHKFFSKFPTVEEGTSKPALAFLQSHALMIEVDLRLLASAFFLFVIILSPSPCCCICVQYFLVFMTWIHFYDIVQTLDRLLYNTLIYLPDMYTVCFSKVKLYILLPIL